MKPLNFPLSELCMLFRGDICFSPFSDCIPWVTLQFTYQCNACILWSPIKLLNFPPHLNYGCYYVEIFASLEYRFWNNRILCLKPPQWFPSLSQPQPLSAATMHDPSSASSSHLPFPCPAYASSGSSSTSSSRRTLSVRAARRWKNYYSGRSSFSVLRAGILITTVTLCYVLASVFVENSGGGGFDGGLGARGGGRKLLQVGNTSTL